MLGLLAPLAGKSEYEWAEAVAAAPARSRISLSQSLEALDAARKQSAVADRVTAVSSSFARSCSTATAKLRLGSMISTGWRPRAAAMDDLPAWLAEITLDPPQSTEPRRTSSFGRGLRRHFHSSFRQGSRMGFGAPSHLVDGAFPSDMALGSAAGLAEERRLFYVATTRARDRLTLYTPLRMPYNRRSAMTGMALLRRAGSSRARCFRPSTSKRTHRPRPRVAAGVAAHATITVDLDHLWR